MTKKMPKYMIEKMEQMARLMGKLQDLNEELEDWLEENGVTDYAFDYVSDWRWEPAYEISDRDGFVKAVNADLRAMGD